MNGIISADGHEQNRLRFSAIIFKAALRCFLFLIFISSGKAQDRAKCHQLLRKADSLVEIKSYKDATDLYFKVFSQCRECQTDVYLLRATKVSLRAGETDSTFKLLSIITNRKIRPLYNGVISDPEFSKLRHDQRWPRIKAILERYLPTVAQELDTLKNDHMLMDLKMQMMGKDYGVNSKRYRVFKDTVMQTDSVNSIKIKSIIRTYGWPGPDQIGETGVRAIIYLYQKLSFKDQKKFYPFISEGFKSGTINAENFSMLSDKIAFRDQGTQIYGTLRGNDKNLLPIENPDSVNYRRESIGLMPIKVN